ncbi:hypothetical protein TorRG33x02_008510 [Trema orientale]|uniref:Uncharacterized protein n=1 Tax=Trema orientale TaxID=63057 RepID=A0A2P5G0T6_TREOI|nr:hypothetical protein TorRG33x02_008510 [Trema orientale]
MDIFQLNGDGSRPINLYVDINLQVYVPLDNFISHSIEEEPIEISSDDETAKDVADDGLDQKDDRLVEVEIQQAKLSTKRGKQIVASTSEDDFGAKGLSSPTDDDDTVWRVGVMNTSEEDTYESYEDDLR